MPLLTLLYMNNLVCGLAFLSCFFHALHSGMNTGILAKILLFSIGLSFYSAILTVNPNALLIPGHIYVIMTNILFGAVMVAIFICEAIRSGYYKLWVISIRHALHIRGGD